MVGKLFKSPNGLGNFGKRMLKSTSWDVMQHVTKQTTGTKRPTISHFLFFFIRHLSFVSVFDGSTYYGAWRHMVPLTGAADTAVPGREQHRFEIVRENAAPFLP
jgi:hypothetical protein